MINKYFDLTLILFLVFYVNSNSQNKIDCSTDEYNSSLNQDPLRVNQINQRKQVFEDWKITTKSSSVNNDKIIVIPVVFHIVHNGESIGSKQNPSQSKINEQLQVLNDIFANQNNKGVDTKIQFCLAKRNSQGLATSGIIRYRGVKDGFLVGSDRLDFNLDDSDDWLLKASHKEPYFPRDNYLNIWIANTLRENFVVGEGFVLQNARAYSTFPFEVIDVRDGIVMHYDYLGYNSSNIYSGLGKTLAHEAGHWLGLYHTFQNTEDCINPEVDCSAEGDEVCDTEKRYGAAWDGFDTNGEFLSVNNCSETEECNLTGNSTNAIQNYMDYNFDTCYSFFTEGQKERMHDMVSFYRPWIYNENNPPVGCTDGIPDNGGGGSGGGSNNDNDIDNGFGYHAFATHHDSGTYAVLSDSWIISQWGKEIHIRKRVGCESEFHQILTVGSLGYERINSGLSVRLIDDNTFAVVAGKNYVPAAGLHKEERYLLIYKNVNNNWSIHKEILLNTWHHALRRSRLSYSNGKLGVFTITKNDGPPSTGYAFKVSIFNTNDYTILNSGLVDQDPNILGFNIDKDGDVYLYTGRYTGKEHIDVYKKKGSQSFTKIQRISFGGSQNIKNWLIRNKKLYVSWSSFGNRRIFVFKKDPSNPDRFVNKEEFRMDPIIGNGTLRDIDVYNDIIIVGAENNLNHRILFMKKENNSRVQITDFSHLYNNPQPHLRKPCRAKYYSYTSFQVYKNELLAGGKMLYKLNQILGDNVESHLCDLSGSDHFFGQNLTIGGSCSLHVNNASKTIVADNQILIKPGTRVSNSSFRAGIQPSSYDCQTINNIGAPPCATYSRAKSKESNIISIEENLDTNITVYPNPNTGTFSITNFEKIKSIEVFNVLGQKVLEKEVKGKEIDVSHLKNGIYNLVLHKKDSSKEFTKIIINK